MGQDGTELRVWVDLVMGSVVVVGQEGDGVMHGCSGGVVA